MSPLHRARTPLVILAVCALSAVTPPPAAQAKAPSSTTVTWGVAPSTAKGPDGRPNFDYESAAGKVINDYVAVSNYSAQPATFAVYANDAINTPTGGFDLLAGDQKPTDVGAWLRLAKQSVTIPAHARANIPVTLTIPANATPGDHVGGIVAALQESSSSAVRLERRIGTRVYLRVKGNLAPALAVQALDTRYHATLNPFGGGDVTAEYTVRNTGNVRLAAGQEVKVNALGANLSRTVPQSLPEVLPGQSVHISVTLRGIAPLGPLEVEVGLNPSAVAGDQHAASLGAVQLGTAHTSGRVWALPWPQLISLILLAAAGYLLYLLWRWRRRQARQALAAAVEQARREERAATNRKPEKTADSALDEVAGDGTKKMEEVK